MKKLGIIYIYIYIFLKPLLIREMRERGAKEKEKKKEFEKVVKRQRYVKEMERRIIDLPAFVTIHSSIKGVDITCL